MGVMLFRNKKDDNMKRFGKFLKYISEKSAKQNLRLISSSDRNEYLKNIDENGTNIFVCHGSADSLYHRYHCKNPEVLIDISTSLKMGKVIAISCGTGKNLGKVLVNNKCCSVYLGFKSKLHFDKKESKFDYISPYYSQYLKELYKEVFEEVLIKAIDNSWIFEKIARVLEWELRRKSVLKAQFKKEKYPHFYEVREINQTVVAATNVAKNIVVYGNGKEKIE